MKIKMLGAIALASGLLASTAMAQDVEVRLLHIGDSEESADIRVMQSIIDEYNAMTPGVTVTRQGMENEALRAKLPTLLQSNDPPDIIASFGGGDIEAQDDAGYLEDISYAEAALQQSVPQSSIDAFKVHGKLVGVATDLALVNFYVNKPLLESGGVSIEDLATWDGFMAAVDKLKAAGITPVVTAGGDKWPVQHWLLYLMLREGGPDIMNRVRTEGFAIPEFIKAANDLIELGAKEPFQDGWLSEAWPSSIGKFGDGAGAIYLAGNWSITQQADNSTDGQGIAPDDLVLIPFPAGFAANADGGTGTVGGVTGWAVTAGASKEAVDFLVYYASIDAQKKFAEAGLGIPSAIGADSYITEPKLQWVSKIIGQASAHQLFADRFLGPAAGGAYNDVAVALAANEMTAEEAAETLQDAWDNR
jgi:raffinose/stachyose/melibiose transport system substrate-binding protein